MVIQGQTATRSRFSAAPHQARRNAAVEDPPHQRQCLVGDGDREGEGSQDAAVCARQRETQACTNIEGGTHIMTIHSATIEWSSTTTRQWMFLPAPSTIASRPGSSFRLHCPGIDRSAIRLYLMRRADARSAPLFSHDLRVRSYAPHIRASAWPRVLAGHPPLVWLTLHGRRSGRHTSGSATRFGRTAAAVAAAFLSADADVASPDAPDHTGLTLPLLLPLVSFVVHYLLLCALHYFPPVMDSRPAFVAASTGAFVAATSRKAAVCVYV